MKKTGGTAAGREDECDFPQIPSVFNDIFQYYFLGHYTHTSLQIKQSPFAPGCQKKSKLEYLLQVLLESHTASVTQSPWIPVVPLHCPRSGVPVTTDNRKYIAGVVFCRSFTWCVVGGGVGQMLVGVIMVSRLKWTRYVSIYTSSYKNTIVWLGFPGEDSQKENKTNK